MHAKLIELEQKEILNSTIKKKHLLTRMERLTFATQLIPSRYPHKSSRQNRVKIHFRAISLYIHERQSQLYDPQKTTLRDLRNDFDNLARIYIAGAYGEFDSSSLLSLKEEEKQSLLLKVTRITIYFLILAFMGIMLLNPVLLPGVNRDSLSLFFLAWLLIGIDRYFELGILEAVLNMAKGLKGLS